MRMGDRSRNIEDYIAGVLRLLGHFVHGDDLVEWEAHSDGSGERTARDHPIEVGDAGVPIGVR